KVESGRAVLSLVMAERRKVLYRVRPAGVAQHMRHRFVDGRVAAPGPFVGDVAGPADAGEHEPVRDGRRLLLRRRKPGDCPDGPGSEEKSVCATQTARR